MFPNTSDIRKWNMSENKTHVKNINMFAKKYNSKSWILAEISNFQILNSQDPGKFLRLG